MTKPIKEFFSEFDAINKNLEEAIRLSHKLFSRKLQLIEGYSEETKEASRERVIMAGERLADGYRKLHRIDERITHRYRRGLDKALSIIREAYSQYCGWFSHASKTEKQEINHVLALFQKTDIHLKRHEAHLRSCRLHNAKAIRRAFYSEGRLYVKFVLDMKDDVKGLGSEVQEIQDKLGKSSKTAKMVARIMMIGTGSMSAAAIGNYMANDFNDEQQVLFFLLLTAVSIMGHAAVQVKIIETWGKELQKFLHSYQQPQLS